MPIARPTMLASASGELKTRSAPKRPLQPVGDLEHAALALDLVERLLAGAVGDVLAEHHDALVARHLVAQAGVDEVDHGLEAAAPPGAGAAVERRATVGSTSAE